MEQKLIAIAKTEQTKKISKPGFHFAEWQVQKDSSRSLVEKIANSLALERFSFSVIIALSIAVALVPRSLKVSFGAVLLSSITFVLWKGIASRMKATLQGLERLRDLPSIGVQYPVKISVKYNRFGTGSDKGFVTFDEGLLHFEGLKTSFTLRSVDCKLQNIDRSIFGRDIFWLTSAISRDSKKLDLTLFLTPLDRMPGTTMRYSRSFKGEFDSWLLEKVADVDRSTYPPLCLKTQKYTLLSQVLMATQGFLQAFNGYHMLSSSLDGHKEVGVFQILIGITFFGVFIYLVTSGLKERAQFKQLIEFFKAQPS